MRHEIILRGLGSLLELVGCASASIRKLVSILSSRLFDDRRLGRPDNPATHRRRFLSISNFLSSCQNCQPLLFLRPTWPTANDSGGDEE
ncbi:hypothetical protein B0T10DRAFT_469087 [Thelonectria olida]|uniref:Uncharacterized protein n=1 Tax=Thelonectria olida TaxID=1576542 RepID=A0A9P8WI21_9HYPO|nr:hypothetical protein B0T10DRAFT_469087 [Thelonectria olida]